MLFEVALTRNKRGGCTTTVPSLPGCIAEEAEVNILEAIRLWMLSHDEHDDLIVPDNDGPSSAPNDTE